MAFNAQAAAVSIANPISSATAAYNTVTVDSYFATGDAQDATSMAGMLMCIIGQSRADLLPNDKYIAQVNFGRCGTGSNIVKPVEIESVRTSSTAAQVVKMWITYPMDDGSDGIMNQEIMLKGTITEAPSSTNPYGKWDTAWKFGNNDAAEVTNLEQGFIHSTEAADGLPYLTLKSKTDMAGESALETNAIVDVVSATGSTITAGRTMAVSNGRVHSISFTDDGSAGKAYRTITNDNPTQAGVADGTVAGASQQCVNLKTNLEIVNSYNLYDSAGALVDRTSVLDIKYNSKNGSIGTSGAAGYWIWIDGVADASLNTVTSVTSKDGTVTYTLVYSGNELTSVTPSSGTLSLQAPLVFAVIDGSNNVDTAVMPEASHRFERNNDSTAFVAAHFESSGLVYEGPGRLWGIAWDGVPAVSFADGTKLVSGGTTYYVKGINVASSPVACTTLDTTLAATHITDHAALYTTLLNGGVTVPAVTFTAAEEPGYDFTTKPSLTNTLEIKVVNGELND